MTVTIIEFIFLLLSHVSAGIYTSDLKYSKKTTTIIWAVWVFFQIGLLFYTKFVNTYSV